MADYIPDDKGPSTAEDIIAAFRALPAPDDQNDVVFLELAQIALIDLNRIADAADRIAKSLQTLAIQARR